MKINGKTLNTKTCVLDVVLNGEPTSLTLTALPPGFHERMRLLGVYELPTRPQRNKKLGGKVLPEMVDDTESPDWPAFVKALDTVSNRRVAFIIGQGLRGATNVAFEATLPTTEQTKEAWSTYGDALYKELTGDGGLTQTELYYLVGKIDELENRFDIKEASKDFLSQQ